MDDVASFETVDDAKLVILQDRYKVKLRELRDFSRAYAEALLGRPLTIQEAIRELLRREREG